VVRAGASFDKGLRNPQPVPRPNPCGLASRSALAPSTAQQLQHTSRETREIPGTTVPSDLVGLWPFWPSAMLCCAVLCCAVKVVLTEDQQLADSGVNYWGSSVLVDSVEMEWKCNGNTHSGQIQTRTALRTD
jgi:hypothetical protein